MSSGALSRIVTSLLMALVITSCTILPEREPIDLYQLPPATLSASTAAPIAGGFRLMTPESSDAFSGSRLLALAEDNSFQAYPGARWAAPIPQLWRDWLLDAFWRDGRFGSLSTDSTVLQSQRSLNGMLRSLHTETVGGRTVAVVRFDAQLIDTSTRIIIASQRFEAREPLNGSTASASVAALGVAADRLARELIDWAAAESSR